MSRGKRKAELLVAEERAKIILEGRGCEGKGEQTS